MINIEKIHQEYINADRWVLKNRLKHLDDWIENFDITIIPEDMQKKNLERLDDSIMEADLIELILSDEEENEEQFS